MSGEGGGEGGSWGPFLTSSFLPSREVLPDSTPAAVPVVSSAPVPSNPGLRDSAFSSESRFLSTSFRHVLLAAPLFPLISELIAALPFPPSDVGLPALHFRLPCFSFLPLLSYHFFCCLRNFLTLL